jgi:hypothetical protein
MIKAGSLSMANQEQVKILTGEDPNAYNDWGKGDESEINDCIYLCNGCHSMIHKELTFKKKSNVPFWAQRVAQDCGLYQ